MWQTENICPILIDSSVLEQMPAKKHRYEFKSRPVRRFTYGSEHSGNTATSVMIYFIITHSAQLKLTDVFFHSKVIVII